MSWCLTRLLPYLSIPALHAPGPHMLQVQSRRTPGDSHTNPTPPANHLLITHSSMCDDRAIVITLRVQIWASPLRPLSCLSAWRACVCTPYLPRVCVCVCVWDLCVPRCASASPGPGKSFEPSHRKASGKRGVREGFRECVRKAVRWIRVHHGCVWPRGGDRGSEQRVSTKEQQISVQREPS